MITHNNGPPVAFPSWIVDATSTCIPCASPTRRRRTSLLSRCLLGSTRSTFNEHEARHAAHPQIGGSYIFLKYLSWLASSSIVLIYQHCSCYVVVRVCDCWTAEPDGFHGGLGWAADHSSWMLSRLLLPKGNYQHVTRVNANCSILASCLGCKIFPKNCTVPSWYSRRSPHDIIRTHQFGDRC